MQGITFVIGWVLSKLSNLIKFPKLSQNIKKGQKSTFSGYLINPWIRDIWQGTCVYKLNPPYTEKWLSGGKMTKITVFDKSDKTTSTTHQMCKNAFLMLISSLHSFMFDVFECVRQVWWGGLIRKPSNSINCLKPFLKTWIIIQSIKNKL